MAIRVTQNATEAVIAPSSQALRVTQTAAEPVMLPTSQKLRVSQVAAEPLIGATQRKLRVSQLVAEVVLMNEVNTCDLPWTFPTVAAYPLPAGGGPQALYFDEITPDWGNYGRAMGDGNPLYGTLQTARIRYFIFEYDGLTQADAAILDDHWSSTRGALSFTLTHPITAEVITGVRYESYERSVHRRLWSQARNVRLVKFTN